MTDTASLSIALEETEKVTGYNLVKLLRTYRKYNGSCFPLLLFYLASQQNLRICRNTSSNNTHNIVLKRYAPTSSIYLDKGIRNRALQFKDAVDRDLNLIHYFEQQRESLQKHDRLTYKTKAGEDDARFSDKDIVDNQSVELTIIFRLSRFLLKLPTEVYQEHYTALFRLILSQLDEFLYDDTTGPQMRLSAQTLCEIADTIGEQIIDKTSTVWDPFAGPGYLIPLTTDTGKYIGRCSDRLSHMIAIMYFENRLFKHREQIEWHYKEKKEIATYPNVVCNCIADLYRCDRSRTQKTMVSSLQECYDQLTENGTGIYLLSTNIIEKEEAVTFFRKTAMQKELKKVIYIDNDLLLLVIRKNQDSDKGIIFINAIPYPNTYPNRSICAKGALQKINDPKNQIQVDSQLFLNNGADLSLENITRITAEKEQKKNFKYVPIESLLTLSLGEEFQGKTHLPVVTTFSLTDYLFFAGYSPIDMKQYTPFLPFCSASDFKPTNRALKEYRILRSAVLFIDHYGFSPLLFNPDKGEVAIPVKSYSVYQVNTNLVDPEYLVNELCKPYFKEQINPLHAQKEYFKEKSFQQCYVSIPDCENSVERQRQIYNYEKKEYIAKLLTQFDVNLETLGRKDVNSLPAGTLLDHGRYKILGLIDNSGFSFTYKAQETLSIHENGKTSQAFRIVAIKEFFMKNMQRRNADSLSVEALLTNKISYLRKAKEKFWDEAKKISQFTDCPNIVEVYRIFDENNTSYYAMEYIDGTDLAYYCSHRYACQQSSCIIDSSDDACLDLNQKVGIGLDEEEAIRIIQGVCSAVKAMHKVHMNHLDIKPENIMITNDLQPILIDFGTASTIDQRESTTLAVYSNGYTPLECASLTTFCPQTDIYSLGATLYNMLTSYQVPSAHSLALNPQLLVRRPGISDKVWNAISRAMSIHIADRPSTVDDFLALLK